MLADAGAVDGAAVGIGPLVFVHADADAAGAEFGGVAEQFVHLGPEALFFGEEGAEAVGAAAAVAAGGLPGDDALVDDEHVDAGAGEPPGGAEAGGAAADDDDGGAGFGGVAHWPGSVTIAGIGGTSQ